MHFSKFLAALCLGTVSLGSVAAEGPTLNRGTGAFVSAGLGGAAVLFDTKDLGYSGRDDETDVAGAYRMALGYWISDHWGIEASYLRSATFTQQFAYGTFRGEIESFGISALGRIQLGSRWSLISRVNVYRTEIKDRSANYGWFATRFAGHSTSLTFGFEGNYAFTENASAYALIETRGQAGEDADVGYLGIGIRWSF